MKGAVERLIELLPEAEIDALLVTNLVNIRYLTGYDGTNGIALIGPQTRAFATDFRYVEQAAEQVDPSFARARASLDLLEAVRDLIPGGEVMLGFDDVHMPVRHYERLRELLLSYPSELLDVRRVGPGIGSTSLDEPSLLDEAASAQGDLFGSV